MLEFYGGLDTLLHKIQKVAMSHFGSGWCVVGFQNDNLSAKPSELLYTEILPRNFSNADLAAKVNFQPLLVVDLWEHSYLLDYKTNKAQYYKRFCSQIDWTRVSLRLQKYLYSSNIKTYRKVKLFHPDARTPSKKYLTDAGWDCYNIEDFTLKPRESKRIPLGIGLQVRNGEYVSVNTRSSIKLKGASALDSVCDAGYTGELYGYIINNTDKQLLFKKGERVFQIVISKIPYIEYLSEGELPESERGTNGFGSTGL
jgi:dUTP pyrophosphatase